MPSWSTTTPPFNWTLNFRQQIYDAWAEAGKDLSGYDRGDLMNTSYDQSALAVEADEKIHLPDRCLRDAGIFTT